MKFQNILSLIIIFYIKHSKTDLNKCYLSRKGILNNEAIDDYSKEIDCYSNCIALQTRNGNDKMEYNLCDKQGNKCDGPVFINKNNFTYKSSCCDTNLCNTPEFHSKNLNYKCELNKTVTKNMKLTYKVRNTKAKSVNQCYSCSNCTKESEFKIEKCAEIHPEQKNFACEVNKNLIICTIIIYFSNISKLLKFWFTVVNKVKFYYGGCIYEENMYLVVTRYYKVMFCQKDLCNSPSSVLPKLSKAIL